MDERTTVNLGIDGIGDATPLAAGGFAQVYTAEQTSLRRSVAVKVLFAAQHDKDSFARFERECHALGAVSGHPNIVVVHDRGTTNAGHPYIIMELRKGGSLSDHLANEGTMSSHEVVALGIKIGSALEVAHGAKVLHRDIKPANILLSSYGEPALADFGIARIEGGNKTTSGIFSASVAHAPREVLDGREPTARSDIYSLGSTLFEAFVGHPPYQRKGVESVWSLISRIMEEDPPDPRSFGMPDALASVVDRALTHDENRRYQSAAEFVDALEALDLQTGSVVSNPPIQPAQPVVTKKPSEVDTVAESLPSPGAGAGSSGGQHGSTGLKRGAVVVATVFSALCLVAAAYILLQDPFGTSPELEFDAAMAGPLEESESYTLRVSNVPTDATYQLFVDGEAIGVAASGLPPYSADPGRHSLYVEVDGKQTTNVVDVYVSPDDFEGMFRSNLASVSQANQDWPAALLEFDKLAAQGHSGLILLSTEDGEWWRLFVDGFTEREDAQGYCDEFELGVEKCFVGPL